MISDELAYEASRMTLPAFVLFVCAGQTDRSMCLPNASIERSTSTKPAWQPVKRRGSGPPGPLLEAWRPLVTAGLGEGGTTKILDETSHMSERRYEQGFPDGRHITTAF